MDISGWPRSDARRGLRWRRVLIFAVALLSALGGAHDGQVDRRPREAADDKLDPGIVELRLRF
jgi:hypothetical protein